MLDFLVFVVAIIIPVIIVIIVVVVCITVTVLTVALLFITFIIVGVMVMRAIRQRQPDLFRLFSSSGQRYVWLLGVILKHFFERSDFCFFAKLYLRDKGTAKSAEDNKMHLKR